MMLNLKIFGMRSVVLAATMAAGCELSLPTATPYAPASGAALSSSPPEVPASAPIYVIDRSVGAHIPLGSYGITTNGQTYYVEWQTDDTAHGFSGDIFCPRSCSLLNISLKAQDEKGSQVAAGSLDLVSSYHFRFDAPTGAGVHQHLEFDASPPVTFELRIDGQPALNPYTAFLSHRQLSTAESMPFSLVPFP